VWKSVMSPPIPSSIFCWAILVGPLPVVRSSGVVSRPG
jgi:hypothetical protein